MLTSKRAVFLDRDGVINRKMPDGDYVKSWGEFLFLPGSVKAIKSLKEEGYLIVVVTNQRCIAKGIITEKELDDIHSKMDDEILANGGKVDAIYYCPHDNYEDCKCRKPKPGMIKKAIEDFRHNEIMIDIDQSYMLGDSESDIQAGKGVGLKTIEIGKLMGVGDYMKKNLSDAAKLILQATSGCGKNISMEK